MAASWSSRWICLSGGPSLESCPSPPSCSGKPRPRGEAMCGCFSQRPAPTTRCVREQAFGRFQPQPGSSRKAPYPSPVPSDITEQRHQPHGALSIVLSIRQSCVRPLSFGVICYAAVVIGTAGRGGRRRMGWKGASFGHGSQRRGFSDKAALQDRGRRCGVGVSRVGV